MICEYNRFLIFGLSMLFGALIIGKLLSLIPKTPKFGFKPVVRTTRWGSRNSYSCDPYTVMAPPIWHEAIFILVCLAGFLGFFIFMTGMSGKDDLNYNCRPSDIVQFLKALA
jgi:hypothetical protein